MLDGLITQVPLVFLDTETTGLNPQFGDRLVEIALARFHGDVMEEHFASLLNPGRSSSPGAYAKHRIADEELLTAPRFGEIISKLRPVLAGAVVVAHNAPFDLGFLSNEFERAREECPDNPVLDTLALLRGYFNFPSNSLPRVAQRLGIQTDRFHRALSDAMTTYSVFNFIAFELGQLGVRTVGDLLHLQGGTVPWQDSSRTAIPLPPALEEALRLNRKIYIRYIDNFGEATNRWVSPIRVHAERDYIYLRAFCHLRNNERQFRLDRVVEMRVEE